MTRVLAFVIAMELVDNSPLKNFLLSVDDIEQLMGLDFLSELDDEPEENWFLGGQRWFGDNLRSRFFDLSHSDIFKNVLYGGDSVIRFSVARGRGVVSSTGIKNRTSFSTLRVLVVLLGVGSLWHHRASSDGCPVMANQKVDLLI